MFFLLFDIFYQDQLLLARLRYDRTMGFINHSQQIPSFPIPAALSLSLSLSLHSAVQCPLTISLRPRHSQIWRYETRYNKREDDNSSKLNMDVNMMLPSSLDQGTGDRWQSSPVSRHTDCICASAPSVTRQGWKQLTLQNSDWLGKICACTWLAQEEAWKLDLLLTDGERQCRYSFNTHFQRKDIFVFVQMCSFLKFSQHLSESENLLVCTAIWSAIHERQKLPLIKDILVIYLRSKTDS